MTQSKLQAANIEKKGETKEVNITLRNASELGSSHIAFVVILWILLRCFLPFVMPVFGLTEHLALYQDFMTYTAFIYIPFIYVLVDKKEMAQINAFILTFMGFCLLVVIGFGFLNWIGLLARTG